MMLSLKKTGLYHTDSGIYGYDFPHGSTGICSLGNGYFYFSHAGITEDGQQFTDIRLYRYTGRDDDLFELCTAPMSATC